MDECTDSETSMWLPIFEMVVDVVTVRELEPPTGHIEWPVGGVKAEACFLSAVKQCSNKNITAVEVNLSLAAPSSRKMRKQLNEQS